MSDYVGEGWMPVEEGTVRFGDQVRVCGEWKRLGLRDEGERVDLYTGPIRRRVPDAAKAEAEAPQPVPVAWGVDPGDSLPIWRCSSEAQANRVVKWMQLSRPGTTPQVVPLMDGRAPAPHPWCRDVARDEAVRRAEDAAAEDDLPVPSSRDLPREFAELREHHSEMIGEIFKRLAALESASKVAPAANADAEEKLAEAMERVRRLESEREDAVLHLPACCGSLGHAAATLQAERDALQARVAELEAAAKAASEAGTVQVQLFVARTHWFVGAEARFKRGEGWISIDLTHAQVAEIKAQVRGEVGR